MPIHLLITTWYLLDSLWLYYVIGHWLLKTQNYLIFNTSNLFLLVSIFTNYGRGKRNPMSHFSVCNTNIKSTPVFEDIEWQLYLCVQPEINRSKFFLEIGLCFNSSKAEIMFNCITQTAKKSKLSAFALCMALKMYTKMDDILGITHVFFLHLKARAQ